MEDNRSAWEKIISAWKNIAKATYETLAPTDIINAAQWKEHSNSWLLLDTLSFLPFVKIIKPLKWIIKSTDKMSDVIKTTWKTRDEYKATKAAKEAFDKKYLSWTDDLNIIDETKNTKWMIYDWDKQVFELTKDWKKYSSNAKDMTIWDLDEAKLYNIKDRWDINVWNMWWKITNKKELSNKEQWIVDRMVNKFKSFWWKMTPEKFINIIKNNPKTSLTAAWLTILASVLWWEDKEKELSPEAQAALEQEKMNQEQQTKKQEQENLPKNFVFEQWDERLPGWRLPHKVFSDELWLRWTSNKRDVVDEYFKKLWVDFVWAKWSSTRNVWIVNALVQLKEKAPEKFEELQDELIALSL